MQIAIVGTGYVGLVTGTCLADAGNRVVCVDIDSTRIDELNAGRVPIYEPGLAELIARNVQTGRLRFTVAYETAIPEADLAFIAVGTPQAEDGSADLRFVLAAARSIAEHMSGFLIVIDKSTVPVGTARAVEQTMREHTTHDVAVISNPEFLKEGDAVKDFAKPDRVIVGYDDESPHVEGILAAMTELYTSFTDEARPLVFMNRESAELTKYASNAMLATRISFMNEIATICDRVGASVDDVSRGMGLDARIGPQFLRAGLGYGGSCFPKDVRAIIQTAADIGYDFRIVQAVDQVNEAQKLRLAEGITARFGPDLSGRTIAVWGLAFKPQTDDMREAPSIVTIDRLLASGAAVRVYDPEATDNFRAIAETKWSPEQQSNLTYVSDPTAAVRDADALLLVTEWNTFAHPDWEHIKRLMNTPVVFDGRNFYDRRTLEQLGFEYSGIGR